MTPKLLPKVFKNNIKSIIHVVGHEFELVVFRRSCYRNAVCATRGDTQFSGAPPTATRHAGGGGFQRPWGWRRAASFGQLATGRDEGGASRPNYAPMKKILLRDRIGGKVRSGNGGAPAWPRRRGASTRRWTLAFVERVDWRLRKWKLALEG